MSNVPHSAVHAAQYEDVDSQKKSSGVVSGGVSSRRKYIVSLYGQCGATGLLVHSLRGSYLCLFLSVRVSGVEVYSRDL